MRGLFVSGTDTGVGKTVVAAAVCAALRARGERVAAFKKWTETSDRMEFRVLETFAAGPIVMNHRIDESSGPARRLKWDGIGVFFVKDGKIKEWSDYTISLEK